MNENVILLLVSLAGLAVVYVVSWKSGYEKGQDDERRAELGRLLDEQDEVLAQAKAETPPGTVLIGYAVYRPIRKEAQ